MKINVTPDVYKNPAENMTGLAFDLSLEQIFGVVK